MRAALTILSFFVCTILSAQTRPYSPSRQTGIQKPLGLSGIPPDGRTYYYDSTATYIRYRPFVSTQEVIDYINTPDKRKGQFPVVVNAGGTLHNGIITGGVNEEWWFKNGVADSNLVIKSKTLVPIDETLTVSEAGVLGINTAVFREYKVFQSVSLLQAAPVIDVGTVYRVVENKLVSDYYVDSADHTTVPDGVMTLLINGYRVKRNVQQYINVKWFGLIGNNIHDDGPNLTNALTYLSASNKSMGLYIPVGDYAIYSQVTFQGGFNSTGAPSFMGEAPSLGGQGATFWWHGAAGGTMFKFRSMNFTRFENLTFVGRWNAGPSAKYLLHFEWVSGGLTTLVTFNKCTFGGAAGDSSAAVNFNATGANTNLQADETVWQDCYFAGNGEGQPDSLKSWWAVIFGGNNTKNFKFDHNHIIGFNHAAIKPFSGVGQLLSTRNITGGNAVHFDLTQATTLLSMSDYAESNGQILKTAIGGTAISSYTLINYENHADNYAGAFPQFPTTQTYSITGWGTLYIQGCTFNSGTHQAKIDWVTDNGIQSVTAIGNNFYGITSRGLTPFYSSENPLFTQDRETDYGQSIQHRLTSINNVGSDATGTTVFGIPNASTDEWLIRGQVRYTAWVGKPISGWYQIGDITTNLLRGSDGSAKVRRWMCTKAGMYKTLSITGNLTATSPIVTGIANTSGVKVGDIVKFSGGFTDPTYPAFVSAVTPTTITISGRTSEATGSVTITNALPEWTAMGTAYGTSTQKTALASELSVTDRGFMYFNTTDSSTLVWSGYQWLTLGSGSGGGGGDSLWTVSGGAIYRNSNVGIHTTNPDYPLTVEAPYSNGGFGMYLTTGTGSGLMYGAFMQGALGNGIYLGLDNTNSANGTAGSVIDLTTRIGGGNPMINFGLFGSANWKIGHNQYRNSDFVIIPISPTDVLNSATKGLRIDTTDGRAYHISHKELATTGTDTLGIPDWGQVIRWHDFPGVQTHTAGASVTISSQTNSTIFFIVNPGSTLASLTITLPATALNGQVVEIVFGGTLTTGNVVTALTVSPNSGQTLLQNTSPTSVEAGEAIAYRYSTSLTKWFRIK